MLKIYNSLTKTKEAFTPRIPGEVGIYVCGNTVYDYCHMGHARAHVAFDVIVRYLRSSGYKVNYIRNITDIDDKIINRANENNESYQSLTERMIAAQNEDYSRLNIAPPDSEPKASESIAGIINIIDTLIDKGYAYAASNGDVYYQVDKFSDYGKLSKKDLSGQISGARVEVDEHKKAPLDFVLWKAAKPGEPSWPSPWGDGRPGWHIECSAMSRECLGENFDIHGGGFDLQFPHHENEIAQSEAANGKPFANLWMHVGFLQVNDEKMSKSLGNFFTIREVLKDYPAEIIRYFLISSHYRSQLNYSEETLKNARTALVRLYQALEQTQPEQAVPDDIVDKKWQDAFSEAMDDDFNTPKALAVLFELAREINKAIANNGQGLANILGAILKKLASSLGLLEGSLASISPQTSLAIPEQEIKALIDERLAAKADKNWARADEIRDELLKQGIRLKDGPEGTTWDVNH